MNIKSRKFIVWVTVTAMLLTIFILVVLKAGDQVGAFAPWFAACELFVSAAYIGGNVWSAYIKSKYFRPELADKEE